MIKVIITEDPLEDEVDFAYGMNAELTASNDATATQCLYMFLRAMQVSGYMDSSINNAIKEIAQDIAEEENNAKSKQA